MRYRVYLTLFLLLALALNLSPIRNSSPVQVVRSAVLTTFYPFAWMGHTVYSRTVSFLNFSVRIRNLEGENQILKNGLNRLQAEMLQFKALKDENNEYRQALDFSINPKLDLLAAEVIGRNADTWNSQILLDKGERQGVKRGQNVISAQGLLGRVMEVSALSSKVMLLTDPDSAVSGVLAKSGTYGIVKGGHGTGLNLEYIPQGVSVEVGEEVSVSSASRIYIRGLPIGKVASVKGGLEELFQQIQLTPSADPYRMGVVFICR